MAITDNQLKILDLYNEGLSLYKQRKWSDAIATFKKALAIDENDGPSKMYVERCELYMKSPPEDDWDGVFVMKTK